MSKQYTPENITSLKHNEIFVFGSNKAGVHGAGAARFALNKFGAVWGKTGLQGQSYGLSTKDENIETMSLDDINKEIVKFLQCVLDNQGLVFYVTLVGCGLAGLSPKDVGDLFRRYAWPSNVILPKEFS
jgi:hypothetical protein